MVYFVYAYWSLVLTFIIGGVSLLNWWLMVSMASSIAFGFFSSIIIMRSWQCMLCFVMVIFCDVIVVLRIIRPVCRFWFLYVI